MSVDLGPFANLDPEDGYRTEFIRTPCEYSVHACVYQGGKVANIFETDPEHATVEIKAWPAGLRGHGEAVRLNLVLEAVARYLTTGGTWGELQIAMAATKPVWRGGLDFPGYYYANGYINTVGVFEHMFIKADSVDVAMLWVEGDCGYIDAKSARELGEL